MSKKVADFSVTLITVVEAASEGIITFLRSGKIEEWIQTVNKWRDQATRDINNFLQLESVTQIYKESCLIFFGGFLLAHLYNLL